MVRRGSRVIRRAAARHGATCASCASERQRWLCLSGAQSFDGRRGVLTVDFDPDPSAAQAFRGNERRPRPGERSSTVTSGTRCSLMQRAGSSAGKPAGRSNFCAFDPHYR
jgi:hypothetical protein